MSTFRAFEEWLAKYKWLELKHDTFSKNSFFYVSTVETRMIDIFPLEKNPFHGIFSWRL